MDELIKVPYYEGHVWVFPCDEMGSEVIEYGMYEQLTIELIRAFVKKGFFFVDIGANLGLHTIAAGYSLGNTAEQRVFAFEPAPDIFKLLELNISLNDLKSVCIIDNVAIGEKEGIAFLNLSTDKNNIGENTISNKPNDNSIVCEMKTLDCKFLSNNSVYSHPIIIKVDIEGYELFALQGGSHWLNQINECAIIYEVCAAQYKQYRYKPEDIIKILNEYGFTEHFLIDDFACHLRKITKLNIPRYLYNVLSCKGNQSREIYKQFLRSRSDIRCEAHKKKYKNRPVRNIGTENHVKQ